MGWPSTWWSRRCHKAGDFQEGSPIIKVSFLFDYWVLRISKCISQLLEGVPAGLPWFCLFLSIWDLTSLRSSFTSFLPVILHSSLDTLSQAFTSLFIFSWISGEFRFLTGWVCGHLLYTSPSLVTFSLKKWAAEKTWMSFTTCGWTRSYLQEFITPSPSLLVHSEIQESDCCSSSMDTLLPVPWWECWGGHDSCFLLFSTYPLTYPWTAVFGS